MKFCDTCSLIMGVFAEGGMIIYKCFRCSEKVIADASEVRISGATNETDTMSDLNSIFIKYAAFDPVNLKVNRPCLECGLAYLTQIQVGDAKVGYVCKCGFQQRISTDKI